LPILDCRLPIVRIQTIQPQGGFPVGARAGSGSAGGSRRASGRAWRCFEGRQECAPELEFQSGRPDGFIFDLLEALGPEYQTPDAVEAAKEYHRRYRMRELGRNERPLPLDSNLAECRKYDPAAVIAAIRKANRDNQPYLNPDKVRVTSADVEGSNGPLTVFLGLPEELQTERLRECAARWEARRIELRHDRWRPEEIPGMVKFWKDFAEDVLLRSDGKSDGKSAGPFSVASGESVARPSAWQIGREWQGRPMRSSFGRSRRMVLTTF
jgi:hypothetical protein